MVLTHRVLIVVTINAQLLHKIPSIKYGGTQRVMWYLARRRRKFYEEVIDKLQFTADAVAKNVYGCDTIDV